MGTTTRSRDTEYGTPFKEGTVYKNNYSIGKFIESGESTPYKLHTMQYEFHTTSAQVTGSQNLTIQAHGWNRPSSALIGGVITKDPTEYITYFAYYSAITANNTHSAGFHFYTSDALTISVSLEKNTTYYLVCFLDSRYSGVTTTNNGAPLTLTFTEEDYTSCTAPTSFTISDKSSKSYVGVNKTASVIWSGATAGTNNPIANYTIQKQVAYYNGSSWGDYGSWTNLDGAASTPYTINLAKVGGVKYKAKFRIKANSSVGDDYDSGYYEASFEIIGNEQPTIPSCSTTSKTITSSASGFHFSVTAGTSTFSPSTPAVYYASTNSSSAAVKYETTTTLTPGSSQGSSKTFYFWTYDGVDYSSTSLSLTVTRNTKPVINNSSSSLSYGTYNAKGSTDNGYSNSVTPTFVIQSDKAIKQIDVIPAYKNGNETVLVTAGKTSLSLPNNSSYSYALSTIDIIKSLSSKCDFSSDTEWKIRVQISDGIESSDATYFPNDDDDDDNNWKKIAGLDTISAVYNRFANSDISGVAQINRRIRLVTNKDGIFNQISSVYVTGSTTSGGSGTNKTCSATLNDSSIDITIPTDFNGGLYLTPKITFKTPGGSTRTLTYNITGKTTTKFPTIANITPTYNPGVIKPFSAGSTAIEDAFSIKWPFSGCSTISGDAGAMAVYNIQSMKLVYTVDNGTTYIESPNNFETFNNAIDSDCLKADIIPSNAYTFTETSDHYLGFEHYGGTKEYKVALKITNKFGTIYFSNPISSSCVFNFNEPVTDLAIDSSYGIFYNIDPSVSSNTWKNIDTLESEGKKIQEGFSLKFKCTFKTLTYETAKINLFLQKSTDAFEKAGLSINYSISGSENKTPVTITTDELIYEVPEIWYIDNNYKSNWKYKVVGGETSQISSVFAQILAIKQTSPYISFTKCQVSRESNSKQLSYIMDYDSTDKGGADSIESIVFYYKNGTSDVCSQSFTSKTGTVSVGSNFFTGWNSKEIGIRFITKVNQSTATGAQVTSTKTYYSPITILVYDLIPIVAYRKNYIGINTETPDENAVLDINANGKNIIYLRGTYTASGSSTTTNVKFKIDLENRTISLFEGSSSTASAAIDFANKMLL